MVEGEENTQLDQDIARKIVPNSRITEADKRMIQLVWKENWVEHYI